MPWIGIFRAGSVRSLLRSAVLPRAGVLQQMYSAISRPPNIQKKVNQFCAVQNLSKSNPKT